MRCSLWLRCGLAITLVAWPSLAQTSDFEYVDEPMLEDRRHLLSSDWSYHGHSFPYILDFAKQYFVRIGISQLLTDRQIDYFQRRGTNPFVLYQYVTEFGITPLENQRLERAGITFALSAFEDLDSMHVAALSDAIVEGTVTALDGYPRGIYHTKVVLDVEHIHKDCGAVPRLGPTNFWLLQTGPHQHGDHVDDRVDPTEPDFRIGERVLILAGSHPLRLRSLVGQALQGESLDRLRDAFGSPRWLLRAASRSRADVLEIYQAFKVVRSNFVLKGGGLRIPQHTDVMDKEYFQDRVAAILEAQELECRARVRRSQRGERENRRS